MSWYVSHVNGIQEPAHSNLWKLLTSPPVLSLVKSFWQLEISPDCSIYTMEISKQLQIKAVWLESWLICDDLLWKKKRDFGAPGWLSRLDIGLQLRSWSHGLWVWALHRALCRWLRAWSLLQILCLLLSLPLLRCALSLSVSKINKR